MISLHNCIKGGISDNMLKKKFKKFVIDSQCEDRLIDIYNLIDEQMFM